MMQLFVLPFEYLLSELGLGAGLNAEVWVSVLDPVGCEEQSQTVWMLSKRRQIVNCHLVLIFGR